MSGVDDLQAAASELRKTVRANRRAFARSPESAFVRSMTAAMQEYRQARAGGVSRDDGIKGLEAVLRDAWPHRPSKFDAACPVCDDTGWRELFCDHQMRCGRERCAKNPSIEHAYVEPCTCAAGARKRTRRFSQEDAITAVGKTARKPRGFSRIGQ